MSVRVKFQKNLQNLVHVPEVVEVSGETVGECLNELIKEYPGIQKMATGKKRFLDFVEIFVNGKSAYPNEETKPLKDGDEIQIMLIFAGG